MKSFIVFLIAAFVCYTLYHKEVVQKREKLIGTWSSDRNVPEGSLHLNINLKPDGAASVDVTANIQGHVRTKSAFGTWRCTGLKMLITFTSSEAPMYKLGADYGGRIVTLDDTTFSYQGDKGVETWTRR